MPRLVVISGCSGGGKSTLLEELRRRGHAVVEEPGRRIVAEELAGDGAALPWVNAEAFARRAIEVALHDLATAPSDARLVFFDRGLVDAASGLEHTTGQPHLEQLGRAHRYHSTVYLTPPWPEIYENDAERRHSQQAGVEEYERLRTAYPALGYTVRNVPKTSVEERANYILADLGEVA
jgi:predicted ATPase